MILAPRLMLYSRVPLSSGWNLASSTMHELSRMLWIGPGWILPFVLLKCTLFRVLTWRCLYCWGSQEYLCWWFPGSCEWYFQCWFFQAYLCLIFGPPYKQACYKWREVLYRDRTRNEEFGNIQSEYNRTPVDYFRCKFASHRGMKTNLWNEKGHANDHFNSKTRWCDLKWLKLQ